MAVRVAEAEEVQSPRQFQDDIIVRELTIIPVLAPVNVRQKVGMGDVNVHAEMFGYHVVQNGQAKIWRTPRKVLRIA